VDLACERLSALEIEGLSVSKVQNQEPYQGYAAHRASEAIVLLSLDSIAPFFPLVEVGGVPNASEFQRCLRGFIVQNRAKEPQDPQNLLSNASNFLEAKLGIQLKNSFEYWYKQVFVHSAEDYREFGIWNDILLSLFRGRLRVDQSFGLPLRVAEAARSKAVSELSLADFHLIDEQHENDLLSAWDTEMYARHGLYEEMKDPLVPIQLTFSQLRYRQFVGWFIGQISAEELSEFHAKIRAALKGDPKFCEAYGIPETFPDLTTQVLPDAENIK
jgi:hypothetical protein